MGKRISIFFVLLFALTSILYSQNLKIQKINKFCEDLDEQIDLEESARNYIMIHEINFESNVRAIGKQYTSIKFFYTQPQDTLIEKNGSEIFKDIYKFPLKIMVDYNVAMSRKVSVDYYPDEKGDLIYYHYITIGAYYNGEEFIYFENGIPVKMQYKVANIEHNELYDLMNYDKDSDFSAVDINKCKTILKNWNNYKKIFEQIIFAEKIDKETN